ncbi:MAG: CoA pyrophosphatase [Gammaproteobacteria bacterium]|nr:CoA pyrophosphatase [Gammaproteobacteria bacterium]
MMTELIFDDQLRQKLIYNLGLFSASAIVDSEKKRAAVSFVITNCRQDANITQFGVEKKTAEHAAFLLTTRSARLHHHAAQRAFPGGRIDADETPEQAALRELHEEVGINLGHEHIIGRLDDYATRSGYIITPIVLWAGCDPELIANPDEVDTIHVVPLGELLRKDAPILEVIPESKHPVLKMPLGHDWVAAPTAAIAYQFLEVAICGRSTSVAHFEQPYFAWR